MKKLLLLLGISLFALTAALPTARAEITSIGLLDDKGIPITLALSKVRADLPCLNNSGIGDYYEAGGGGVIFECLVEVVSERELAKLRLLPDPQTGKRVTIDFTLPLQSKNLRAHNPIYAREDLDTRRFTGAGNFRGLVYYITLWNLDQAHLPPACKTQANPECNKVFIDELKAAGLNRLTSPALIRLPGPPPIRNPNDDCRHSCGG